MSGQKFLAFDLGAESGRAVLGILEGARLDLTEVHRFPNEPVSLPDGLHWDALRLYHEMETGLAKAAREHGRDFAGIAVDTWGVDYCLLGGGDTLLGEPYHYRDHRTDRLLDQAFTIVPREEIFAGTGIQIMPFNTLYQLLAARLDTALLAAAQSLLFMPGLFTFLLTGLKANDLSIASTSQCYSMPRNDWAWDLLDRFAIPRRLFGPVAAAGTIAGALRPQVAERTGARGTVVITAGHDTASAVAAIPAEQESFMYISCGTWSLAGVEIPRPVVHPRVFAGGFTNEGGAGGTIRLLKNIGGLWLIQECRRTWKRRGEEHDYQELTARAGQAPAFKTIVNPDDPAFLNPADMPAAIAAFARRTGQSAPATAGEFVRAVLESLAMAHRRTLEMLEGILDRKIEVIHMVGGGAKNDLLCQFTADAAGRPVITGPIEATAAGNILVQAMALGILSGSAEARAVVRRSFDLKAYEPRKNGAWDEAYLRYLDLCGRG